MLLIILRNKQKKKDFTTILLYIVLTIWRAPEILLGEGDCIIDLATIRNSLRGGRYFSSGKNDIVGSPNWNDRYMSP